MEDIHKQSSSRLLTQEQISQIEAKKVININIGIFQKKKKKKKKKKKINK